MMRLLETPINSAFHATSKIHLLSERVLASESALAGLFGKIMIEKTLTVMNRSNFRHDGLTLSYLDSGGELPVTIALHAHWMKAPRSLLWRKRSVRSGV